MLAFLATILGAFIGAGLAPFIINFFGERNKRLEKLREAYRLSEMVFQYYTLTYACNSELILMLRNKAPYSPEVANSFNKIYPKENPMQEFFVLLDFDLAYPEDEVKEFKSTCARINLTKANLRVCFHRQQYDRAEALEKDNESLHNAMALFCGKIESWSKAEKEATKNTYVLEWYKRMKLEKNKKAN